MTNNNNSGPGSLRQAIADANSGDTITFDPGILPGTITLTSGSYLIVDKDLTIDGPGASDLAIDGNNASRVFLISGGTVAISDVTIQNGSVFGNGGGIANVDGSLTITNVTVSDNTATGNGGGIYKDGGSLFIDESFITGNTTTGSFVDGGGIYSDNSGTLTITNSTISGNTAASGGGIRYIGGTLILDKSTISGNTASLNGGGVYNSAGTLTVTSSTISGNTTTGSGGGGGGIYNFAGPAISTLTVTNSTISGNAAPSGGGILSNHSTFLTLTVTNSTISGNSADDGGGISIPPTGCCPTIGSGTVDLINTIIANNPFGSDCSGAGFTSLGHNLASDFSCNLTDPTDIPNTDPLLGPLQDNGGSTFTHALLPGSPAIDAGDDAAAPATDQRGVVRPRGVASDIGAFEFTLIVNSADDGDDGVCDPVHCSLREAINAANADLRLDTIDFNIPGAGPHTIQPASALPTITDPVVIDGYTQPGASPNTNGSGLGLNTVLKIELDGTNAGVAGPPGLMITAGSSTVRGLVINSFSGNGIRLDGLNTNGINIIEGNFIGTDVTGTTALANSSGGILIFRSPNNTIGGTTPAARNVISGHNVGVAQSGIRILGSSGNLVQGNLIGTDVTGTAKLGNSGQGIIFQTGSGPWPTSNNLIGGILPGAGNVISGNGTYGVRFLAGSGNNLAGNLIGTQVDGVSPLGNGLHGVVTDRSNDNEIGGITDGAGNVIAFNGGVGVLVFGTRNPILSNSIFSNGDIGIDLFTGGGLTFGVTPNDAGDGDTGGNNFQNFPVLTSAVSGSGATTIEGTLNSTPSTTFRLEFFSNTICDPSGFGEGETFLGTTDVTTDGSGNASFMVTFPDTVAPGQFITSTATDPDNNTSEFSECTTVLGTVLAPRDLKEQAIETLQTHAGDFPGIGAAIQQIELSLAPQLWIDESRLDPAQGFRVFRHEKDAVQKLRRVFGDSGTPDDVRFLIFGVKQDLVEADRLLALIKIEEAEAFVAPSPELQARVDQAVATARKWLERGDQDRDAGRQPAAISRYYQAWNAVRLIPE